MSDDAAGVAEALLAWARRWPPFERRRPGGPARGRFLRRPCRPLHSRGPRHTRAWQTTPIRPGLGWRTTTSSRVRFPGVGLSGTRGAATRSCRASTDSDLRSRGGLDERSDLVGEEIGIEAGHDRIRRRILLAAAACRTGPDRSSVRCPRPSTPAAEWCASGCAARRQRAQVGDELLFVARRQERREQDDVWNPGRQRRDGGVTRVDEDQVRVDLLANDALENGGLTVVRLDCEDERQGLRPYHEEKEHGTDHREDQERAVLETLSFERRDIIMPPKSMARLSQDVMPSPPEIELRQTSRVTRGSTYMRAHRRRARKPSATAASGEISWRDPWSAALAMRMPSTDLYAGVAVSDAHTRHRWRCVRVAHNADARGASADAHQIRVMPYETAPGGRLWRRSFGGLDAVPRALFPCGNRFAMKELHRARRRATEAVAQPLRLVCCVSRQARRSYQPNAALPQVRTAKERCIFLGGGFHVDATQFREVGRA